MRALMVTLHKYVGLALGVVLAVTGLSGSVIVFDHALDEIVDPRTVAFTESDRRAPLASVLERARVAVPGDAEPYRIYIARRTGSPHVVRFPAPDGAPGPIEVSVSPVDAEVLAVRIWGEYAVSWVYRLHYTLLAGTTGKYVVGFLGIALLFFCLSGLVIWWPRRGQWRRALTIARGRGPFRFNYDLHKTAGVYLLPLLAVVSFSGVKLVFPGVVESLVRPFAAVDEAPTPQSKPRGERLDVDRAVAIAQTAFPEAALKRVHLPGDAADSYQLFFNQPKEPWTSFAASKVWVDQYDGEILSVRDPFQIGAGSAFLEWQFPLHNGDALGLVGRWAVFVTGLLPALLFGTGVYMWWRKRRPARSAERSRTAPLAGST